MKTLLPLLLLAAVLVGSGCVASIGGGTHRGEPTLGKQLTDLRQARQEGAITEQEYQVQKAKLLGNK